MKGRASMNYHSLAPTTLLSPVPVALVSCADGEHPERKNLLTVAWTGTVNTTPPMVSISIKPSRYSYGMIRDSGEFVINLVDRNLCRAADFCGVRSGRDEDKAEALGLVWREAEGMKAARAVDGAPVSLSCRVRNHMEMGSHDMFLGEIVSVSVREDLMDAQGGIHLERAGLVAYNHGLYQALGQVLGFFGYAVARPEKLTARLRAAGAGTYVLKSARFLAADYLRSVLTEGDRAIDATVGNGHDTAMLCRLVGEAGHVYGFDLQEQALDATRKRLKGERLEKRATLWCMGHEHMGEMIREPVRAAVFNLGWLPGGDHQVTTRTETTMTAVKQALKLLSPGGMLVICVYPGHPEGKRERKALEEWMTSLPAREFNVLAHCFLNAGDDAPRCYGIQRNT